MFFVCLVFFCAVQHKSLPLAPSGGTPGAKEVCRSEPSSFAVVARCQDATKWRPKHGFCRNDIHLFHFYGLPSAPAISPLGRDESSSAPPPNAHARHCENSQPPGCLTFLSARSLGEEVTEPTAGELERRRKSDSEGLKSFSKRTLRRARDGSKRPV